MLKICLTFALFCVSLRTAVAQNTATPTILLRNDSVFTDGKPFCLLTIDGGSFLHFSLSSLAGEELILASPKVENDKLQVYEITILPTAQNTTWRPTTDAKNLPLAFVRQIYLSGMVANNAIDENGLKYYMDNATEVERQAAVMAARPKDDRRVKRDRDADVQVLEGRIKQSAALIGVYSDTEMVTKSGARLKGYRIALPDGTLIAEASLPDVHAKTCVVITEYDRHEHTIAVENFSFAVWKVAEFLVENDYL